MKTRIRAALIHLSASVLVALLAASLVFRVWYPYPFSDLLGGRELFLLLISVDVICGPLLTLVVFNPAKPKPELWRDMSFIVVVQVLALLYGLWVVMQARPIFVAFEGDRFRVVRVADIDLQKLNDAPAELRTFGLLGPRALGVRLLESGGIEYLQSIQESLQGNHPAFRPERWRNYDQQRQEVIAKARPLTALKEKNAGYQSVVNEFLAKTKGSEGQFGYLPLIAGSNSDWVVVVEKGSGELVSYLPLDGW